MTTMDNDDRKRLQANHKNIVDNVRVKDVKDHLLQCGILTMDDFEEVSLSTITQTERIRRLMRILPKRGPKAFPVFIESLKEEYEYLAKQILNTDISEVILADDQNEVDNREKLDTLQRQLWQQTQLIVQFQDEIASLKSKVEEKERQDELEQKLSKDGMRQEMVAFLHYKDERSSASSGFEETDSGKSTGDSINVPSNILRAHTDPIVIKETAMKLGFDVMRYISDPKSAKPAKTQYMINMRRVVSDVLNQHSQLFEQIVQHLEMNELNGYETLLRIADEIFRGQANWGRIGVWYTFGASVGLHCEANSMPELANWIAEFTGIYVAQNLLEWIQKNDGWNGLNKFVADREQDRDTSQKGSGSLGLTLGALGIVGLSLGAYAAFKAH